MNSNPLLSLEAASAAQKDQGRSRVRIAVFSIVAVHVAGLMALLLTQGCKRETPSEAAPPDAPAMDTSYPSLTDSNLAPAVTTTSTIPAYPEPPTTPVLTTPTTPTDVVAPTATKYVVQQGDSFYTIAKAHGVTQKAVQDANPGVDPKKLKPKQEINLPAPTPAGAPTTTTTPAADAGGATIYTVKSGDTLSKIADHFKTTTKAIKSLNNLTTDRINVNQKLKIPAKAATVPETAPVVPSMAPTEVPPAPVPPAAH